MTGGQLRIEAMYAFVALDPDDNTEGVVAFMTPQGWVPMVGADLGRVEQLRPLAQEQAKELGLPILLLNFTNRTEVEVIDP
jgi:hypothetical protein